MVNQIMVQAGDKVTQGQVLATEDPSDDQIAVNEAQASLAEAQDNLSKLEAGNMPETIAQAQAHKLLPERYVYCSPGYYCQQRADVQQVPLAALNVSISSNAGGSGNKGSGGYGGGMGVPGMGF